MSGALPATAAGAFRALLAAAGECQRAAFSLL